VIHILLDQSFAAVDTIEALKHHQDLQTLISIVNQKSLLSDQIQASQHAFFKTVA
jgi:hypothetical protein